MDICSGDCGGLTLRSNACTAVTHYEMVVTTAGHGIAHGDGCGSCS